MIPGTPYPINAVYNCQQRPTNFKGASELEEHERIRQNNANMSCTICPSTFADENVYRLFKISDHLSGINLFEDVSVVNVKNLRNLPAAFI